MTAKTRDVELFEVRFEQAIQPYKDLIEKQQQQIKLLQDANRTLTTRLNKLDRNQHHQHQSMY